jgi:hypothetical protein
MTAVPTTSAGRVWPFGPLGILHALALSAANSPVVSSRRVSVILWPIFRLRMLGVDADGSAFSIMIESNVPPVVVQFENLHYDAR